MTDMRFRETKENKLNKFFWFTFLLYNEMLNLRCENLSKKDIFCVQSKYVENGHSVFLYKTGEFVLEAWNVKQLCKKINFQQQ